MVDKAKHKLTLDQPATYRISVPGHLARGWLDWAGEMTIAVYEGGDGGPVTSLTGKLDQAALHGLLSRLYSLGLPLISVTLDVGDLHTDQD